MKRLWALVALVGLIPSPAFAAEQPILGTMPAYPGATRPLKQLESNRRAIALTPDKPEAVIAYYMSRLTRSGWQPAPGAEAEAYAAALAKEPVWMTFLRPGLGRLDIQVTQGRHPKTGQVLTMITYQADTRL
jgi:hypothetical protein